MFNQQIFGCVSFIKISPLSLEQLLSVLKSNTLLKPKAHAVLSVAGLDAGMSLHSA